MPLSRKPTETKGTVRRPLGREPAKITRSRPSVEVMDEQVEHSYAHRGESGKYGNIYKGDVRRWKLTDGKHEVCLIPYQVKGNSMFRTSNPDFNKPFSADKLKSGEAWAHKLTALIHGNIGPNQDQVLCPRTLKQECPICIKRGKLYDLADAETNKDKSAAYKKQADALGPAKRAIYNIFCFDTDAEMQKGVQVWEAPHQSIEDVLSELYKDERTGEKRYYTVPEEGWNFLFKKEGKGLATKYTGVQLVQRQENDSFNEQELDQRYKDAYNLEEIIEVKSNEELTEMMSGMSDEVPEERPAPRDEDAPLEERPTGRFRGRGKEPEKPTERETERKPVASADDLPEELVDCFGVECNQRDPECENCDEKIFDACYKEFNKGNK